MVQRHLVRLGWEHLLGTVIYHIGDPGHDFVLIGMSKLCVPESSWVTSILDPKPL